MSAPGSEPPREGRVDRASLAVVGFADGCDVYERGRPGYPDELVRELVGAAGPGGVVLDVAAGTGKLTRQLVAAGVGCVAVEPSGGMRDVLARAVRGTPVVAATAEALPVAGGRVDLVTVAQAFHWFDTVPALAELARVLRGGGWLALIWNERDESLGWMAELGRIMRWREFQPYRDGATFRGALDASGHFEASVRRQFGWVDATDRAGLVDLVASRSYVNAMAPDERTPLLEAVAALADTLPETIEVPYVTDVYLARRRDR